MIVGYGRGRPPRGSLPVFTVESEEEAQELLTLTCPKTLDGQYFARELAHEQTLENLELFAKKLEKGYIELQERKKRKEERG